MAQTFKLTVSLEYEPGKSHTKSVMLDEVQYERLTRIVEEQALESRCDAVIDTVLFSLDTQVEDGF